MTIHHKDLFYQFFSDFNTRFDNQTQIIICYDVDKNNIAFMRLRCYYAYTHNTGADQLMRKLITYLIFFSRLKK